MPKQLLRKVHIPHGEKAHDARTAYLERKLIREQIKAVEELNRILKKLQEAQ